MLQRPPLNSALEFPAAPHTGSSWAQSSKSTNSYSAIDRINAEMNAEDCRRLLAKVDKMREILRMEKIALPQIVVVGDQSVGKSSILEAISGVELPRAQNICTRCPLELRLKRTPSGSSDYATIRCEGVEQMTIQDLSEISTKIIECTNFLTGNTVNVSRSPIFLTVYKQEIQDDLTLIDLPGITRTQLPGQSATIYQDIISLIEMCVKPDSAVVVHVIPSSTDFSTSESIQICQRYDPRYERQIIAVSKIDKHDQGIAEKLQGMGPGSLFLSLGCVAVLNRKQEEIDAGVSFAEMRQREEEFFRTNPAFANVPEEYLGSTQLVKKLVAIQQERIRSILPNIIEQVRQKIITAQEELRRIPPSILNENQARVAFNDLVRTFCTTVEKRANGEYDIHVEKTTVVFDPKARDKWDARIAYHLKMIGEWTSKQIENILSNFYADGHGNVVLKSIKDNYGGGLPNFPSTNVIQQLYQPHHKKLEEPCKGLVMWVEEYVTRCLEYILQTILPEDASYKAVLIREMGKVIRNVIVKSRENCIRSVEEMLAMEEKVFTVNPHYTDVFSKLRNNRPQTSGDGHLGAHDVLIGLQAYCCILHARLVDHLSQLCEYWFVRNCILVLDRTLHTAFGGSELLKIMKDLPALEQRRANLRRTIDAMEKALAAAEENE